MKTARKVFDYLNYSLFNYLGFRLILASSTKESRRKAKEMNECKEDWWINDIFYKAPHTIREDSIDALYDYFIMRCYKHKSSIGVCS